MPSWMGQWRRVNRGGVRVCSGGRWGGGVWRRGRDGVEEWRVQAIGPVRRIAGVHLGGCGQYDVGTPLYEEERSEGNGTGIFLIPTENTAIHVSVCIPEYQRGLNWERKVWLPMPSAECWSVNRAHHNSHIHHCTSCGITYVSRAPSNRDALFTYISHTQKHHALWRCY